MTKQHERDWIELLYFSLSISYQQSQRRNTSWSRGSPMIRHSTKSRTSPGVHYSTPVDRICARSPLYGSYSSYPDLFLAYTNSVWAQFFNVNCKSKDKRINPIKKGAIGVKNILIMKLYGEELFLTFNIQKYVRAIIPTCMTEGIPFIHRG